jgi:hypothetical protein
MLLPPVKGADDPIRTWAANFAVLHNGLVIW